ncbi:hypothetical protein H8S95_14975 [Pontibacter sp. KCTC 32443]|uniref:hypothetical protein n=1 Tax=Pontibacter TaxID=323449 RepID=UPI00164E6783|nr:MULTISPECIES: hypothetical protein [Pontibacter]MBC5775381.1 hypothetical protein [Pontibacter sp. KCTC 32443]
MHKLVFILTLCLLGQAALAQDSTFIKVHFLYGSKPHPKYKNVEEKWFGGVLGGHVGIEAGSSNQILNFVRKGKFHWFPNKRNPHSTYIHLSEEMFYDLYKTSSDSIKRAIVYIPITTQQKQQLANISTAYLNQTPYDYALTGMRCAAATYEILAHLNIVPAYTQPKTATKILYPKKLRTKLFALASTNNWKVEKHEGSVKRIWDRD